MHHKPNRNPDEDNGLKRRPPAEEKPNAVSERRHADRQQGARCGLNQARRLAICNTDQSDAASTSAICTALAAVAPRLEGDRQQQGESEHDSCQSDRAPAVRRSAGLAKAPAAPIAVREEQDGHDDEFHRDETRYHHGLDHPHRRPFRPGGHADDFAVAEYHGATLDGVAPAFRGGGWDGTAWTNCLHDTSAQDGDTPTD